MQIDRECHACKCKLKEGEQAICRRACTFDTIYCESCAVSHLPCYSCQSCSKLGEHTCKGCNRQWYCSTHIRSHESDCNRIHVCSLCGHTSLYASIHHFNSSRCKRCVKVICPGCVVKKPCNDCSLVFCSRGNCGVGRISSSSFGRHQIQGQCTVVRCGRHNNVTTTTGLCSINGCRKIACPRCVTHYPANGKSIPFYCARHASSYVSKKACPCCRSRFPLKPLYGRRMCLISHRLFKGREKEVLVCMACFMTIRTAIDCMLLLYPKIIPKDIIEAIVLYYVK